MQMHVLQTWSWPLCACMGVVEGNGALASLARLGEVVEMPFGLELFALHWKLRCGPHPAGSEEGARLVDFVPHACENKSG